MQMSISFAPQYITGMTGQHLGLQWFAFLRWGGWQFEVTWQQEVFVAVLALKKPGAGQTKWHYLFGRRTGPCGGIFPEEDAHPDKDVGMLFYWTCHRVSFSVRVRIARGRQETEFNFVLPPMVSHPCQFTVQMWIKYSLPFFPIWRRPYVWQERTKKATVLGTC